MVQEAEAHATEDKKRRESAEVKNQAEALIHATEKTIADLGDKAPAADKTAVEAGIADLKTAIEAGDTEAIKAKSQALSQTAMKLGEALYKAQGEAAGEQQAGEAGGEQDAGAKDDGIGDADFEEGKDRREERRGG